MPRLLWLAMLVSGIWITMAPLWSEAANADSSADIIETIRNSVLSVVSPEQLGAGYVALLNFAVNPDISTATYYIDGGDDRGQDVTLDVYRLPLRHVFKPDNTLYRPFVQANFAYQTYNGYRIYLADTESIGTDYKAYGGSITLGLEIPVAGKLVLLTAVNSGLAHLENRASYDGPTVEELLRPALKGYIFDWDADAWQAGVSSGLQYSGKWHGTEYRGTIDVTYNHFATYHSSSNFVQFKADVTTCSLQLESLFPLPDLLFGTPLSLVTSLGHTSFYGDNNDTLGFSSFFESGIAFETDIGNHCPLVKKLRLGAKLIAGGDVAGWSLILGYRF